MKDFQPEIYPTVNDINTKEQLADDLRNLGICKGDLLNIKVSLKSIGFIEGGPNTLIESILEAVGPEGTIVSDSFINVFPLPVSDANGKKISDRWTPSYAGAVANAMISFPGSFRSLHPIQKFVAIGRIAEELTQNHTPESYAYDVLRAMCDTGGKNLKIGSDEKVVGVGTTHVACWKLGFIQNRPLAGVNYINENDEIVTFERNWAGGCGVGFNNFLPLYRQAGAILSEGNVGNAISKITDMKKTLEVELEKLSEDPSFFFCDDPACANCRLSWDFSTGNLLEVKYHRFINKLKNRIPLF